MAQQERNKFMKALISLKAAPLFLLLVVVFTPLPAKAGKIMKADAGATGNITHAMMVVYGKMFSKYLGIEVQINDNQTLLITTKSPSGKFASIRPSICFI